MKYTNKLINYILEFERDDFYDWLEGNYGAEGDLFTEAEYNEMINEPDDLNIADSLLREAAKYHIYANALLATKELGGK
jgi:hypothetical protein